MRCERCGGAMAQQRYEPWDHIEDLRIRARRAAFSTPFELGIPSLARRGLNRISLCGDDHWGERSDRASSSGSHQSRFLCARSKEVREITHKDAINLDGETARRHVYAK